MYKLILFKILKNSNTADGINEDGSSDKTIWKIIIQMTITILTAIASSLD